MRKFRVILSDRHSVDLEAETYDLDSINNLTFFVQDEELEDDERTVALFSGGNWLYFTEVVDE